MSEWLCCGDHTHRQVREGFTDTDEMTIKVLGSDRRSHIATRESKFMATGTASAKDCHVEFSRLAWLEKSLRSFPPQH
jgi:hypothetical protein